jgi:hypothetical protein
MKIEFVSIGIIYRNYCGWTIDKEDYPELKGLTTKEVMSYLEENAESMNALNTSLYANLY